MATHRDRLIQAVGGLESFGQSFNWRTHFPERAAEGAIAGGVQDIEAGLATLSVVGATPEMAEQWIAGYVAKWTKYQSAGARTANWMITGPARFPVDRNRKRMEVEHKRMNEVMDYVANAGFWARNRLRKAERREAVAAAEQDGVTYAGRTVAGVRLVENTTMERIQLFFPGKPDPDMIAELKARAFRWAPSVGAWQRQLTNNGRWAAECVLKKLHA